MTAIPAALRSIRPPLLVAYGFRPFFLLSGIAGFGLVAGWLAVLAHGGWPPGPVAPAQWHAHEMLFAFAAAAIAGFLLTAVPGWTGTQPRHGWPLGIMVALWLAGRLVLLPGVGSPPAVAAVADLAFLPALAVALAGPLVRAGKARNTAFVGLLAVLTAANLLFHLDWLGVVDGGAAAGERLAIAVVLMMVTVVGGRIVPNFTRNALNARGITAPVVTGPWVERAVLGGTLALLPLDLLLPDSPVTGIVALAAGLAHAARLSRWQGLRTLDQPIVWILHAAYAWIPVGLLLKAAALLGTEISGSAAIHALTVGAFASMILAVMTRATLGHTGRRLDVPRPIAAAYVLVLLAGALRVLAALVLSYGEPLLHGAGAAWLLAFGLYLWVYGPMLLSPRVDGRPG
ncbi:uncharacterized protein involved in response to NO [Azospirillum fermentarium]|uniref:NnrS family protein n=1 Tax=Azospirillum fermentarium TaxID=1233114 RepID=UPI0022275713|nr:NnrS family protein [Azospirillum fermentarium]MCW2246711.1 uncharacterized protein involved in response to NO [Azospirillum fermentarium]